MEKEHAVILFDGTCNFCSSSVNFIIEHDARNRFKFATIQSEPGRRLLKQSGLDSEGVKTIILIENGRCYTKSTAALRIAKELKGFWKVIYVFIIVPPLIRNIPYSVIAKYRYIWFGKGNECRVPSAAEKEKFLD